MKKPYIGIIKPTPNLPINEKYKIFIMDAHNAAYAGGLALSL